MSLLRKGLLPAVALALFALSPLSSHAQGFNPMLAQQQAEAKKHVEDGKAAAAEGRHADAVKLFKKADELDPKPETKFEMAKSLVGQRKLNDASTLLNELLASTPPPPFSVKNAAQKLLTEVQQKIPWLQIKIIGPDQSLTSTTVNGKEIDAEEEIPFDPGDYTVAADADGYKPVEKKITIEDGEHELVELTLERIGGPRPKKTPPAPTTPTPDTAPTSTAPGPDTVTPPVKSGGGDITSGPFFIPMVAGGGLGVAGLGVGTVFGILALTKTAEAEDCTKSTCLRAAKSDALLYGNVSTIAFIAGGVGVATGVTMLILQMNSAPPPPKPAAAKGFVMPYVGVGQAGVFGAF